jgi:hypothetical protein
MTALAYLLFSPAQKYLDLLTSELATYDKSKTHSIATMLMTSNEMIWSFLRRPTGSTIFARPSPSETPNSLRVLRARKGTDAGATKEVEGLRLLVPLFKDNNNNNNNKCKSDPNKSVNMVCIRQATVHDLLQMQTTNLWCLPENYQVG